MTMQRMVNPAIVDSHVLSYQRFPNRVFDSMVRMPNAFNDGIEILFLEVAACEIQTISSPV